MEISITFTSEYCRKEQSDNYSPLITCKCNGEFLWARVSSETFTYSDEAQAYGEKLCKEMQVFAIRAISDLVTGIG